MSMRAALPNACLLFQAKLKTQECGRQLKEVADKYGEPPLVIVDYAQIVSLPQELRIADELNGLKLVASELRRIVDEVHCPLFAISSINRTNYDKQDHWASGDWWL